MSERWGCRGCWPDSPEQANLARRTLDETERLVDRPQLQVVILRCPGCSQAYAAALTEKLDSIMPITEEEAVDLILRGSAVGPADLAAVAPERKSLAHAHREGMPAASSWRTGLG
jgi:hypothetical protein